MTGRGLLKALLAATKRIIRQLVKSGVAVKFTPDWLVENLKRIYVRQEFIIKLEFDSNLIFLLEISMLIAVL